MTPTRCGNGTTRSQSSPIAPLPPSRAERRSPACRHFTDGNIMMGGGGGPPMAKTTIKGTTTNQANLQFDRVAATCAALVVVGLAVFLLVRNEEIADFRLFFVLRVVL